MHSLGWRRSYAGERRYIEKQKPRVVNGDVAMEGGGEAGSMDADIML